MIPLGIALVAVGTGLLPRDYLGTRPAKALSVSEILADAANRIRWQRGDIDRILIFSAVVLALIILTLQTVVILATVVIGHAHAATPIFSVAPEAARSDIILIFLDQIFGEPGIFNTGAPAVGSPAHAGIHALLGFYSQAMMIIASLIILYHIVVVVGESAQSGTPFGKRFNGLWAPIRLVLALGLLVPLGTGLNAAQYITLYTAKIGSSFASNAWSVFAAKTTDPTAILTAPTVQATRDLVKNVFVAEVCRQAMSIVNGQNSNDPPIHYLQALGSRSTKASLSNASAMIAAARAAGLDKVTISWTKDPAGPAIAQNTCGSMSVLLNPTLSAGAGSIAQSLNGAVEPLTSAYIAELGNIINDLGDTPRQFANIYVSAYGNDAYGKTDTLATLDGKLNTVAQQSTQRVKAAVDSAYNQLSGSQAGRDMLKKMVQAGWGGAGIWYVKIGQLNQQFQEAVRDGNPAFSEIVSAGMPGATGGTNAVNGVSAAIAQATIFAQRIDPVVPAGSNPNVKTGGGKVVEPFFDWSEFKDHAFESVLHFLFRTDGLRLLRTNPTLDPMVVLASAGDHMIQQSMMMFTIGIAAKATGETASESWLGQLPWFATAKIVAKIGAALGGFITSTALIGVMAGVVLFYLLPLLPFVYFFFSIIGWGLSIVEALVAGPLWALAHLRIDGDGLPGQAGITGYVLLFEIMLRPIFIVAGLIIGYTVFGAGAYLLSTVFDSVTNALDASIDTSWFDQAPTTDRGASGGLDNFVYTILFTILVYGMGVSCFKLSDKLPDHIMRWMGVSASPFAGGKDAPDMQGTVLAGGAAVHSISSGVKSGMESLLQRKKKRSDEATALDGILDELKKKNGSPPAPETTNPGQGTRPPAASIRQP